ncbi:hypothetical protein [Natronincola ferrireducens]|uniref:Uncharacterized protein n=1 Tax=Natronincola ferrireducens TaxID=393762 RepID=A0A1G9H8L8_9FIRM|nr:hypothetical protein [Natronincola ferrireducens]SDL09229.1 hypothetical protein SAMN05660472_02584 [Natronincola ferrireducens]
MNKNIEEVFYSLNEFDEKFNVFNCDENNYTIFYNAMISGLTQLILCKKLFKRNKDIVEFLDKVFNIKYPDYVNKNRALILGRTIRYVSEIDDSESLKAIINKLYEVISKLNNDNYNPDNLSWHDAIKLLDLNRG